MFSIAWAQRAFDQMQAIIRDNPTLKAGFIYSLQTLNMELTDRAGEWGESRSGSLRLGSAGILAVLVRVNPDARVVRVVDVKLERRTRRG
jgi:hypothetical protein